MSLAPLPSNDMPAGLALTIGEACQMQGSVRVQPPCFSSDLPQMQHHGIYRNCFWNLSICGWEQLWLEGASQQLVRCPCMLHAVQLEWLQAAAMHGLCRELCILAAPYQIAGSFRAIWS